MHALALVQAATRASRAMKTTEKTPLLVAAIGGVCALAAAVIGLFNPVVTKLAERALDRPTPTAIYTAAATPFPSATATALPTPLPTFAVPHDAAILLILANNNLEDRAFFIDAAFVTQIASGAVLVFNVPPGTHQLEDCAVNKNPIAYPDDCGSQRYDLQDNPFDWTLGEGAANEKQVTLVLSNSASTPTDIYFDGKLAHSLEAHQYFILNTTPGKHMFQNCPSGETPDAQDSMCADAAQQDLRNAVEIWKVGD